METEKSSLVMQVSYSFTQSIGYDHGVNYTIASFYFSCLLEVRNHRFHTKLHVEMTTLIVLLGHRSTHIISCDDAIYFQTTKWK